MNSTQQERWAGGMILSACIAIPLFGCVLAVVFKDDNWLILLAPLIVFMEGFFVLVPLAWLVVEYLIGK